MTTTQLLKDEQGTPIFAVIPYGEYLRLLKDADQNNQSIFVSDVTEIPLPYSKGSSLNVIRLVDFFHRMHEKGVDSLPIEARNEVLSKLMERYETPESQQYPGLDVLIRLYFLPADSPYRNTRQAVKEVTSSLENTGIFSITQEKFPSFYRTINALKYSPNEGIAYLKKHGARDQDGNSLVKNQIPINPFEF